LNHTVLQDGRVQLKCVRGYGPNVNHYHIVINISKFVKSGIVKDIRAT
jgi:hypothetical protein